MAPEGLPPGFCFHPTDFELVWFYLKPKIHGLRIDPDIIPEIDVYKSEPWLLPEKSFMPSSDSDRPTEFYLFAKRERKYLIGFRTNRSTPEGYWKSTGKDRRVLHNAGGAIVGMKKTLVYHHRGRAGQGVRTDWVMHEYRLHDEQAMAAIHLFSYALCRVFNKKAICTTQQVGVPPQGVPSSGIPSPPEVPVADDDDYSWLAFLSEEAGCSSAAPVEESTSVALS